MTRSLFDGDDASVYSKFAVRPYQEYVDEVAEIYGCDRQDVIDFLNMERERRGLKPVTYNKLEHDPYVTWTEEDPDQLEEEPDASRIWEPNPNDSEGEFLRESAEEGPDYDPEPDPDPDDF